MAFTERIKIVIDVAGDTATRGLRNFSTSVKDADGLTGKFKAGIGSLGDSFRSLGPAGQAGLAAGGISAVGLAAYSAVDKFADLGIEVGKFSDATGLSAEESSRWVEVVGDLGVEAGSLSTSLNKLNKEIDPERFEELGIAIERTSDGAVDVNGTFLNVIDRLNGIKDPAEKAKLATELLGKGWQDMAEVIATGSTGLRKSLADVSDAKVINDDEVAKAREFRAALDNLMDVGEDLVLTLGSALAPALISVGETAAEVGAGLVPIAKGLADVFEAANKLKLLEPPRLAGNTTYAEIEELKTGAKTVGEYFDKTTTSVADTSDAVAEFGDAAGTADTSAEALAEANQELAAQAEAAAEKSRDLAAALIEQVDAAIAAADASIAAADAHDDMAVATEATNAVLKDSESTLEDLKDAVDGERDAAIESATANQRLAEQMAAADGKTLSATQRLDVFNQSLIDNATNATPAARQAIYDYLIQVNQIPAEKATEIKAAVAAGDLDTANALLAEASRTRTAAIEADAQNVAATELELNNLARTRRVNFVATRTGGGLPNTFDVEFDGRASGGPVRAGQPYIVGERGRELMVPGVDGTVIPANETRALMNGSGRAGGGIHIGAINVAVTAHGGQLDPQQVARALTRAVELGIHRPGSL